jgi:hypothetical protein
MFGHEITYNNWGRNATIIWAKYGAESEGHVRIDLLHDTREPNIVLQDGLKDNTKITQNSVVRDVLASLRSQGGYLLQD